MTDAPLTDLTGTQQGLQQIVAPSLADLVGSMLPNAPHLKRSEAYKRNLKYVKTGAETFQTKLSPQEEAQFQQWLKANPRTPFDPSPTSDYDMRGWWKAHTNPADPNHGMTKQSINANDNQPHYHDYWKTPYHESFSAESQFADPTTAPAWNRRDQLVEPAGKVVFDEPVRTSGKWVSDFNRGAP